MSKLKTEIIFYRKAKKRGDEDSWNIAKFLRNTVNSNIRQAKREFVLSELKEHENNPKKFWKVIKGVIPTKKDSNDSDILLKDNGLQIGRERVAHYINDYFVNVGNFDDMGGEEMGTDELVPSDLNTEGTEGLAEKMKLEPFREVDVYKVVKEINTSKSSGLSHFSSFIIKEVFGFFIPEITFLMNLSISSGSFPDAWKKALVVPIPKSGNLTMVKNYRPISLIPLPGKILEKLVHQQLSHYLETSELLSDFQHGFRKGHSTLHAVAQITSCINSKLDSRLPTVAAYIDFRKAFDCVQHSVLLEKLKRLNLHESVVKWVESYLEARSQRVYANNVYSSYLPITQGVPQGSVLGPLFYIIYANDLCKIAKNCNIALYADDTVLYTSNENFGTSVTKLQNDLDSLSDWCRVNGIAVNADKTKLMTFGSKKALNNLPDFKISFDGIPIQKVTSYKYLGMTLDIQLNYNLHISRLISSAASKLKQFRRMRTFLDTKAAIIVYKSMILPLLEYGDIFLSAASAVNWKRLQVLQNKGLRCALNREGDADVEELHISVGLSELKHRRRLHLLHFMFGWSQRIVGSKSSPEARMKTRSHNKKLLKTKRPRTEKFKKSFAYNGPKSWNELSADCHHAANITTYKSLVNNWFLQKGIADMSDNLHYDNDNSDNTIINFTN